MDEQRAQLLKDVLNLLTYEVGAIEIGWEDMREAGDSYDRATVVASNGKLYVVEIQSIDLPIESPRMPTLPPRNLEHEGTDEGTPPQQGIGDD